MNKNTFSPDKLSKAKAFNPPHIEAGIILIALCSAFVGVGVWFLADFLFIHHYNWTMWENLALSSVFIVGGGISGGFAIRFLVRQIRKRKFQKRVIENGEASVGLIFDYKCIKRFARTRSGGTSRVVVRYDVSFNYSYVNSLSKPFIKAFSITLDYDPQLYQGSKIMLAIDGDDALVLDKFTLSPQSEQELKAMAAEEDEDNFRGLSKKPPIIDRRSIDHTAEFSHVKFWGGIAAAIFTLIQIGIFSLMLAILDVKEVRIVVGIMACVVLIPLIGISCYFIISGKKSKEKEKRILPFCRFAWANINIPTGVYTLNGDHRPSFCFIDADGNKRSYKISGSTARKYIKQNVRSVAAYTDTEALLLIQRQYSRKSVQKKGSNGIAIKKSEFSAAQKTQNEKSAAELEKKTKKQAILLIAIGTLMIAVAIGVFFGYCRPFVKFEHYECVVKGKEWFDLDGDYVKVIYYVDGEKYENTLRGNFGGKVPFCYNVEDPSDIMSLSRDGLMIFMPIVAAFGTFLICLVVWHLRKERNKKTDHDSRQN